VGKGYEGEKNTKEQEIHDAMVEGGLMPSSLGKKLKRNSIEPKGGKIT